MGGGKKGSKEREWERKLLKQLCLLFAKVIRRAKICCILMGKIRPT